MKKLTVSEHLDSDRLQLFLHLMPIIGFFPSLWTLYCHERDGSRESVGAHRCAPVQRSREEGLGELGVPTEWGLGVKGTRGQGDEPTTLNQQHSTNNQKEKLAVSRLSVTLALSWLLSYILLSTGAETSEFLSFRLLMLNSLLTSGYFLVSVWLMLRLTTRKSVRLPGFSALADRAIGKRKNEA